MLGRPVRAVIAPIVQAPMAGGVSNPALAAAVSNAGGLGFLAAGYQTATHLREQIAAVRAATSAPFGVNVFVPGNRGTPDLTAYRRELAQEAQRYAAELGDPPAFDDDDWDAKLAILFEDPVPVVSFTFGCPPSDVTERLHGAGSLVIVTVTSSVEATSAMDAGADALCVQGPEAGAHRSSFGSEPDAEANSGLLTLLQSIREATRLPQVANQVSLGWGRCLAGLVAFGRGEVVQDLVELLEHRCVPSVHTSGCTCGRRAARWSA